MHARCTPRTSGRRPTRSKIPRKARRSRSATGHGVFEGARDAHAWAIGVDSDQHDDMPGTVLTSMVKRVDVAVFDTIVDAQKGVFSPGIHEFGLREGGVDYVHDGDHGAAIPADVKARVEELRAKVIAGEILVPSK